MDLDSAWNMSTASPPSPPPSPLPLQHYNMEPQRRRYGVENRGYIDEAVDDVTGQQQNDTSDSSDDDTTSSTSSSELVSECDMKVPDDNDNSHIKP